MTVIFNPGREGPDGPYAQAQAQGAMPAPVEVVPSDECDLSDIIRRALGTVGGLFNSCADKMQAMNDSLERGELDDLKDAVKLARDMRGATLVMIEERNRIEKLRRDVAGGCGGAGALDLDAAREEVGRRLACLRRAAGS